MCVCVWGGGGGTIFPPEVSKFVFSFEASESCCEEC